MINAEKVQELRERSGLPLQECRKLLERAKWDVDEAMKIALKEWKPIGRMDG